MATSASVVTAAVQQTLAAAANDRPSGSDNEDNEQAPAAADDAVDSALIRRCTLRTASKFSQLRVTSTSAAAEVNVRRLTLSPEAGKEKSRQETQPPQTRMTAEEAADASRQHKRCLIDPRSSTWMQGWDIITTVALLFIALVTPFEVGFLPAAESADAPLFICNRVLDGIFTVDLVLNFFIIQEIYDVEHGLRWIDDQRKIIRLYLRGWFTLDLLSILVSAFDIIPVAAGGDLDALQSLTPLRLLRALRLLRLLRLSKMSRILKRWETSMAIRYSTLEMLKCLLLVILSAHWSACVYGLIAAPLFVDDPLGTWVQNHGFCMAAHKIDEGTHLPVDAEEFGLDGLPLENYWRGSRFTWARGEALCVGPLTIYLAALHWGLLMVTGTAEPTMHITPTSTQEQLIFMLINIFTQAVWAHVLATFTSILLTSSPGTIAFRTHMDALNRFMSEHSSVISHQTKTRLREYLHRSRHIQQAGTNAELLRMLSPALQGELAWKLNRKWVSRVSFLRDTETAFLVEVSLALMPMVFAPGELPQSGKLYIIHRGLALYGGKMLTAGGVWGEDIIINDVKLRKPFVCTAMTYLEVYYFTFERLKAIAEAYPESQAIIRRRQRFVVFRRTIVALAKAEAGLPQDALLASRHDADGFKRDKTRSIMDALAARSAQSLGTTAAARRREYSQEKSAMKAGHRRYRPGPAGRVEPPESTPDEPLAAPDISEVLPSRKPRRLPTLKWGGGQSHGNVQVAPMHPGEASAGGGARSA